MYLRLGRALSLAGPGGGGQSFAPPAPALSPGALVEVVVPFFVSLILDASKDKER